MKRSMNSSSFKKYFYRIAATTTILAVVTCLIPDAAEALPRLRFSGRSSNAANINFDIDLLATDENSDSNAGNFPRAIRNFTYQLSFSPPLQAQFDFGDLTTSLDGPNNTVKYEITFNPATTKLIPNDFGDPNIDPPVLFAQPEDFRLTLLISSTDLNLVETLSEQLPTPIDLEYFGPQSATYRLIDSSQCVDDGDIPDSCLLEAVDVPDSTEDIPEPATALGLLGFGALGTAWLRKRKKH